MEVQDVKLLKHFLTTLSVLCEGMQCSELNFCGILMTFYRLASFGQFCSYFHVWGWGWGLRMIWGNYEISLKYETLTTEVMILRCKNPGRWYRVRNNFLRSLCFVFCARFEINSRAGVIWGTGALLTHCARLVWNFIYYLNFLKFRLWIS